MDVPKLSGNDLLEAVVAMTGLPEQQIQSELDGILAQAGMDRSRLTVDELRFAMAAYLQTFLADTPGEGSDEELALAPLLDE